MPRLLQHVSLINLCFLVYKYGGWFCCNVMGFMYVGVVSETCAHVFLNCRTTVFSHSQTVVVCGNCQTVLCQPTGGRARLTEGCSFRKKGD